MQAPDSTPFTNYEAQRKKLDAALAVLRRIATEDLTRSAMRNIACQILDALGRRKA